MILAATNQTLEIRLDFVVTANQLPFSVEWSDITSTGFTPGHSDGQTNNTTVVTMVSAPAASTYRAIKHISVQNKDTGFARVYIQFNNNGTVRELIKCRVGTGYELTWSAEKGWRIAQVTQASDSVAGIIRVAGQGTMRAGSELIAAVTPGYQGYHPAMCKCWGKAVGAGTSLTVGYNTTSVTDTGTGRLGVNMATDMSGDYAIKCTVERSVTALTASGVEDNNIRVLSPQSGSFEIGCNDHTATTMTVQDPANYFWAIFGSWV